MVYSFLELVPCQVLRWHNLFCMLIENTQQMKTITDFPLLGSDLLQSNRLVCQDFRDIKEIAVPLDLAVVSHSSNGHARTVLYGREFVGIAPWGAKINTARGLSPQGLMGTLAVILLYEKIIFSLLSSVGWLRRNIVLKRSMHP